jgi:hypothetical protein
MPTEREKQAEKERVTRISGFRVGYHDFLAEVNLDALKKRNDRWEAEHRHQSLLDRKTEELIRIAAYVAMRNPPHHIQIHVHSASLWERVRVSPQPTLSRLDVGAPGAQRRGVAPLCASAITCALAPLQPSQVALPEVVPPASLRHSPPHPETHVRHQRKSRRAEGSSRDGGAKRPFEFSIRPRRSVPSRNDQA